MSWIDSSRTRVRAVVVLPAGRSFNKDFFAGTLLPSIVDDKALSRRELKANGPFRHLDKNPTSPHF
jgi:hypothetical protein